MAAVAGRPVLEGRDGLCSKYHLRFSWWAEESQRQNGPLQAESSGEQRLKGQQLRTSADLANREWEGNGGDAGCMSSGETQNVSATTQNCPSVRGVTYSLLCILKITLLP